VSNTQSTIQDQLNWYIVWPLELRTQIFGCIDDTRAYQANDVIENAILYGQIRAVI